MRLRNDMGAASRLVEVTNQVPNPLYGKYKGLVTATNDPEMRGRIKAYVPFPLGEVETEWCEPCIAGNIFDIPPINAGVWIEFEHGDPSQPIWVGRWYRLGEAPFQATYTGLQADDEDDLATNKLETDLHKPWHDHTANKHYSPHMQVWFSPSGHYILFEDWRNTGIDKKGRVTICDRNGRTIELSENGWVEIGGIGTGVIRVADDGKVYISGTNIYLGDGVDGGLCKKLMTEDHLTELETRLADIKAKYNSHTHVGGSAANPPTPAFAIMSDQLDETKLTQVTVAK